MKEIPFTQAKAQFSSVVDEAVAGEPLVITRHGKKEAVIVSFDEWQRRADVPSLWELLTSSPVDGRDLPRFRSKIAKDDV